MMVPTADLIRYENSLSDKEKRVAIETMIDCLLDIDVLHYDPESQRIYWEANGCRLGE